MTYAVQVWCWGWTHYSSKRPRHVAAAELADLTRRGYDARMVLE